MNRDEQSRGFVRRAFSRPRHVSPRAGVSGEYQAVVAQVVVGSIVEVRA